MCMRYPSLRMKPDGTIYLSLDRCRSRLCPLCGAFRAKATKQRILAALPGQSDLRFLTLTLKSDSTPLKAQLEHLIASFRRLRQTRIWKETQRGGVATIQVTWNPNTKQWHPHLHCILDGSFVKHAELKTAWIKCSDGSSIVHIKAINDREAEIGYVCRYVASPDDLLRWPPEVAEEYALALAGRRAVQSFGTLHNSATERKDKDKHEEASTPVVPLRIVQKAIRSDHRHARTLYGGVTQYCPSAVPFLTNPQTLAPGGPAIQYVSRKDFAAACEEVYEELTRLPDTEDTHRMPGRDRSGGGPFLFHNPSALECT